MPSGGSVVTERGVVYSTFTNPTVTGSKATTAGTSGNYSTNLTSLTGNTKYYIRAYVTNDQGTTYSAQTDFTTPQQPSVPTVVSGTASSIATQAANFNGNEVTLDGTFSVTERGVVFSSTTNDPTIANTKVVGPGTGLGTYNVSLSSLAPETTYYIRAYATNSMGTGYGAVQSFKTLALFIPDAGDGY